MQRRGRKTWNIVLVCDSELWAQNFTLEQLKMRERSNTCCVWVLQLVIKPARRVGVSKQTLRNVSVIPLQQILTVLFRDITAIFNLQILKGATNWHSVECVPLPLQWNWNNMSLPLAGFSAKVYRFISCVTTVLFISVCEDVIGREMLIKNLN